MPVVCAQRHRTPLFTELPRKWCSQTFETFKTPFPSRYPCRCESSATRIHCRVDAKLPELNFRARLMGGTSKVELTLV